MISAGTTGTGKIGSAEGLSPSAPKSHIRQILDALYDTVLVIDLNGNILEANGRAERQLGYSREDLLKMPVSRLIQDFTTDVIESLRKNLEGGKFTVLEGYCRSREKGGFLAELTAGRLGENGVARLLLTLRNIEPRRKTQEMLRAAHNALENAASGIAITDPAGVIIRGNPSFLQIWEFRSIKEAVGLDIRKLFEMNSNSGEVIQKPLAGDVWMGELESRTRKGRPIFVQVSAAPNQDSESRMVGLVFSILDITARKKAEDALRREADAQISRAREATEFSGLLTALTIPDLVQLISSTRKTGTLTILADGDRPLASIGFQEGETRRAQCGELSGEEAFFAMLRVAGQGFRFEAKTPIEADPAIQRSTMGLLLEGARLVDEASDADRVKPEPPAPGEGFSSGMEHAE